MARPLPYKDREQWLEIRRHGVGGSDAPVIAGVSSFKSKLQLYLEKLGEPVFGEETEAMYWGTQLEALVAEEFRKRTGMKVRRVNRTLQHSSRDWQLVNLDREILDKERGPGVLECKTTSRFRAHDWDDDHIPEAHLLQVQHALAVTDREWGALAVLIGGQEYKHTEIERDEEVIAYLIEIEAKFWECVKTRTPPPLEDDDFTPRTMRLLYPKASAQSVILPMQTADTLTEYRRVVAQAKELEREGDRLAAHIQHEMGDAEAGYLPGSPQPVVTWRNVTRSTWDTKRLSEEHPELAALYKRESSSRTFRLGREVE